MARAVRRNRAHSTVDLLVVGGGVAGCATAIAAAARGASVAVIHRADRNERLGETLAPSVRDALTQLAVWDRFRADRHEPSCGVWSAWGGPNLYCNDYLFHPHGVGWHVDRARFDGMMRDAACDGGATLYEDVRATDYSPTRAGWDVDLHDGEARVRLAARVVVDATGRAASFARRLGARVLTFDRLIGIARFYHLDPRERTLDSFTLLEAAPDGWWYSAFLPGDRLVAIAFTDPDFRHCVEPPPHTAIRMAKCHSRSEPIISAAHTSRLDRAAGNGWLAVGDAATAWDPLSSQGIANALRSGASAATAALEYLSGDSLALHRYAKSVRAGFERYLGVYQQHYRRETRWPEAPFWRRRHALPADSLSRVINDRSGRSNVWPR